MKKLFLFFALPIVATLSFVSCGNDDDENNAPEEENLSDGGNKPNNNVFHEYVDLGLPSGTLWATCNVGATKPEEFGDYFAWGETEPKEVYDWSTYKWGDDEMTKYNSEDGLTILLPEDDAATVNWGKEWRMPTQEEQRELMEECYMVWTDGYNGTDVSGVIFYKAKSTDNKGVYVGSSQTSSLDYNVSSDTHVFLPAAGNRWDDELDYIGCNFDYLWSSSLSDDVAYARDLFFYEEGIMWDGRVRWDMLPVRAVRAK